MIISDLSHLDIISEDNAILGSARTTVSTVAVASGNYTKVKTVTSSYTKQLPRGGSMSISFGYAKASAVDSYDASANTNVYGAADGDIQVVNSTNYSIDTGRQAQAEGVVFALGITRPR